MWNIILVIDKYQETVKGFDERPLRFTEKNYAEITAHELQQNSKCAKYIVIEEKNE